MRQVGCVCRGTWAGRCQNSRSSRRSSNTRFSDDFTKLRIERRTAAEAGPRTTSRDSLPSHDTSPLFLIYDYTSYKTEGWQAIQVGAPRPSEKLETKGLGGKQKQLVWLVRGKRLFDVAWLGISIQATLARHGRPCCEQRCGRVSRSG